MTLCHQTAGGVRMSRMPAENPDSLAALTASTSTQLVAAMSTDTWTAAREWVARLFNRTDSAQIQEAVDALSAQAGDTTSALASQGPRPGPGDVADPDPADVPVGGR